MANSMHAGLLKLWTAAGNGRVGHSVVWCGADLFWLVSDGDIIAAALLKGLASDNEDQLRELRSILATLMSKRS